MRHVDDAHHAEGDGEADRGEQQHAAEADPLEQIGGDARPAAGGWPIAASAASAAFRSSGSRPGWSRNSSSRFLTCGSVASASARIAASCSSLAAGRQPRRRAGSRCIAARISGSCSAASAFSSSAAASAEGCFSASRRGGEPGVAVGAEQGQRAERRLDRAAQPVVDDDPVEAVGGDARDLLAAHRVAQPGSVPPAVDDQTIAAVGRAAQPVVAQRLQDRHGARVAELAERDDRLFLGGEAVAAEPGDQRREIRRPAPAAQCEQAAAQATARRTAAANDPSGASGRYRKPIGPADPPARFAGSAGPTPAVILPRRRRGRWVAASGGQGDDGASASVTLPSPPPTGGEGADRRSSSVRVYLARGAVAADPGIGPVGDLALVLGEDRGSRRRP